ncbi:MAG: 30S ribosome-binding factor RbfA [Cyanobacteria bacterium]|jgi:ribosome-binding factor A|nr:30S ribosome-binding factor RbfA [Cyanobacteriota bacterium]
MKSRQDFNRSDRVRKAIMREVGDIIAHGIKDPRLTNEVISVTDVEVTQDLRFARIFISILGDEEKQTLVQEILKESQPKIRQEIGQRIRLRYVPEIDIRYDDSLERGARVSQILDKISKGEV